MLQPILFISLFILVLALIIIGFTTRNIKIKNTGRKIFFPFLTKKYVFLETKRGYRLLKVFFLLGLLFSMGFFFSIFTNIQEDSRQYCIDSRYSLEANNRDVVWKDCNEEYKTTAFLNGIYSILITLVINYIIQFVYFQLIIYIVYGNNKK